MKNILLSLVAASLSAISSMAVPAAPGIITVAQPDGSALIPLQVVAHDAAHRTPQELSSLSRSRRTSCPPVPSPPASSPCSPRLTASKNKLPVSLAFTALLP